MRFAVEKVAPAAYGLGQCHRRYKKIKDIESVDFLAPADYEDRDDAEQKTTVYGQTSASDIEH
jgi:hypothetical protein